MNNTRRRSSRYCTFYIVRHTQSTDQLKKVLSGHRNPLLSNEGIKQAKRLTKTLSNIQFDASFSSDLLRAQQTAEIILGENKLAVVTTKLLRERNYGRIDGKKLEGKLLKEYKKFYSLTYEDRLGKRIVPDMENDEEIIYRFINFLRETALAYIGKTVLVVSHGNIMKTLLVHLGFATHEQLQSGSIDNAGYLVLRSDGVDFFIDETQGIHLSQSID